MAKTKDLLEGIKGQDEEFKKRAEEIQQARKDELEQKRQHDLAQRERQAKARQSMAQQREDRKISVQAERQGHRQRLADVRAKWEQEHAATREKVRKDTRVRIEPPEPSPRQPEQRPRRGTGP